MKKFKPKSPETMLQTGETGKRRAISNIFIIEGPRDVVVFSPYEGLQSSVEFGPGELAEFVRMLQSHLAES